MGSRAKSRATKAAGRSKAKRSIFSRSIFHKRLPDSEVFDRIELVVATRLKQSDLSGDEWRSGIITRFWFKGKVVAEYPALRMDRAILFLGHRYLMREDAITDEYLQHEEQCCDQVGCSNTRNLRLVRIVKEYSADGQALGSELESEFSLKSYRKFCPEHAKRGNASREDNDKNYVPLTAAEKAELRTQQTKKKSRKRR